MRALLVEDNDGDARLVKEMLLEASSRRSKPVELTRVDRLSHAVERLRTEKFDTVLLDLSLPDGFGIEVFTAVHAAMCEVPCIVLTGLADEALAAEAVRRGAQDYLIKGELTASFLMRSIEYAVERGLLLLRMQTLLQQRTAALAGTSAALEAESEGRAQAQRTVDLYAEIVENIQIGLIVYRLDADDDPMNMRVVAANPAASVAARLALDELVGRTIAESLPHMRSSDLPRRYAEVIRTGTPLEISEIQSRRDSISDRVFALKAFPLPDRQVGVAFEDIGDRVRLTEQLHQSQKMEAVGRLAGGVAHDLNNLLMAIKSFGGFVQEALEPSSPPHDDIAEVLGAADRAAELVGQLLAFSRRQPLDPKVVDMNTIVLGMERMLHRVLGADVDLVARATPGLWHTLVDAGRMEQMIVNLAVNARDAMPEGGKLTIETGNAVLDEEYCRSHVGVSEGEYVMLAVSDTGTGMTPEVQAHAFEPFFTTKDKGKGTGLGLATCYGTVKQVRGHIWVYSEVGRGTTFKIYLPRTVRGITPVQRSAGSERNLLGTETVLVLEDEPSVRVAVVRTLKRYGYVVLEAVNGGDALLLCQRYAARIDILVTDIVMPGMSGRQFVERVTPIRPEMKVLYISGYTENAIAHHGVLDPGTAFLAKPFTSEALARRVRDVLDFPQTGIPVM